MRRLAVPFGLILLAACTSSGNGGSPRSPEPTNDELQFEMAISAQIAFDVTRLKRGEWSLYSVRILGKSQTDYVKFQVVDEDPTSLWVENKVPSPPRDFVLKSKFDKSKGTLLEHWRGEPGSPAPAKVYPREGAPSQEPPVQRDTSKAQSQIQEAVDQIKVGGKSWTATRVTTTLTYPDGRKSVLTDWYHKDVPFSVVMGGKSYGGLVKRQFGRLTMELVDSDSKGARAELEIPR
jgi:hypothetical protein